MRVTHTQTACTQQPIRNNAHCATLANDADRPIHRLDFGKHRRKAGHSTRTKICQALRIRTHYTHPTCSGAGLHRLFLQFAFRMRFAKTRAHHNTQCNAGFSALVHSLHRQITWHSNDGHIWYFRQTLKS